MRKKKWLGAGWRQLSVTPRSAVPQTSFDTGRASTDHCFAYANNLASPRATLPFKYPIFLFIERSVTMGRTVVAT